jgi:hypothetical protein
LDLLFGNYHSPLLQLAKVWAECLTVGSPAVGVGRLGWG